MRHFLLPLAILLCPAGPALAQVTVDLHALDALPSTPGAPIRPPAPRPPPAPHAAVATTAPSAHAASLPPVEATPAPVVASTTPPAGPQPPVAPPPAAASPPPAATLPEAPPLVASIPPILPPEPVAGASPPPAPPIAATATTTAAATQTGLRLTFASGQSDLSPGSADSIKQVVQAAPAGDATTFNVLAYASGDSDDQSVARRLSLARAIAVRAALMADGVPSSRIYLRALGSEAGQGPADRVDLSVLGVNASQR